MNSLKQYVSDLSDEEKRKIVNGWVVFEREGSIGDSPIRHHAEQFIDGINGDHHMVVMWMEKLAFEVYRYYADLMLDQLDDPLSAINQMRDY